MEEITIDQVREFYQEKKRMWAKTKSYYQGNPEWGTQKMFGSNEPTGYELKPPYSEDEIFQYETKQDIKLPENLRNYLIEVTREIFVSHYPMVFNLNDTDITSFEVPEHKTIWNLGDCVTHGRYPQLPPPHDKENNFGSCKCPDPIGGIVEIGEGGCSNTTYLVIRGNHIGEVWDTDGDSYFKQHDSFWDYITKPLKPKPQIPFDPVSTAIAVNFLLMREGFATLKYKN